MNIKSLSNILTPTPVTKKNETERKFKTEGSTERDANGQQQSGSETEKRNLSPEELDLALKHLRELPGVKNNDLKVVVREQNDKKIVFIEDASGKVVRRIPENELLSLVHAGSSGTGHLFNKAL